MANWQGITGSKRGRPKAAEKNAYTLISTALANVIDILDRSQSASSRGGNSKMEIPDNPTGAAIRKRLRSVRNELLEVALIISAETQEGE